MRYVNTEFGISDERARVITGEFLKKLKEIIEDRDGLYVNHTDFLECVLKLDSLDRRERVWLSYALGRFNGRFEEMRESKSDAFIGVIMGE